MNGNTSNDGGFLPPSLPSPSPSNTSNISNTSNLPHPRSHPLRPGSAKEDAARRFVENRLMYISRRYTKKFQPPEEGEDVHGYNSMEDVSKDLAEVVDVLWLSGTPSLQIPYLLNVALSVTSYISAFPPAPVGIFKLLKKLDHAFASLLSGEDSSTGEPLPGFEGGRNSGMSRTDMIRCKSLIETTRVLVVEVMSREPEMEGAPTEESGNETDAMSLNMPSAWDVNDDDDENDLQMNIARVYEATMTKLGELLSSKSGFEVESAPVEQPASSTYSCF